MWLLAAPVLAFTLLAAHFLRVDAWALVALSTGMIASLAVPRPWAAHVTRIALLAGALEWLRTLIVLAAVRLAADIPSGRMIVILMAVVLLNLAAFLVFRHPTLRRFYHLHSLKPLETNRSS